MSVPLLGSNDAPATTGSIAAPVEVQKPLPQTLAYSDATKIGQAAAATLWQAEGGEGADWVNSATGSSGTVEASGTRRTKPRASSPAGAFSTIVTSIGGVHHYSGDDLPGRERPLGRADRRDPRKPAAPDRLAISTAPLTISRSGRIQTFHTG